MIPLLVDLTSKKVVVFGGGEVGLRKATYLSAEAEVVIVSREPCHPVASIRTVKAEIVDEMDKWVDWADLVVAATNDPALNEKIVRRAEEQGKPFNSAHSIGSFLIPATVEKAGIIIAVSTRGRSPAMARYLKKRLESELGDDLIAMVALQEEIRTRAKTVLKDQTSREELLWSILEDQKIWTLLRTDPEGARKRALEHLEVMVRTSSLVLT